MKRTEEMKIIKIDELVPYANNARTHSKDQINKLRSSLREFGFVNPIIMDKEQARRQSLLTKVTGHYPTFVEK